MFDIVAVGELLIDFTPSGTTPEGLPMFVQNPGGGPPNMLAAHALLGGQAAFIGKVGQDQFATFLNDTLVSRGINTTGIVFDKTVGTTLAFVHLAEDGDRDFSFHRKPGADMMLKNNEVDYDIINNGRIIHMSGLMATSEPARDTCHKILSYVKNNTKSIVSFDPNYRHPLWESEDSAKKEYLKIIPLADILKISEEELMILTGSSDIEKGAQHFLNQGPKLVLISLGEKGAYYSTKDYQGYMPTYQVNVVDTTGAGDAFLGSILYKLAGKNRDAISGLTKEELDDILDFGNATGSLSTTKKGGIPSMPTLNQVEEFRANTPKSDDTYLFEE